MPEINLFGAGTQSKSSNITAAHRINVYYDIQQDGDKSRVVAYGTPGLELFSNPSTNPTRGMWWMKSTDVLYVVQRGDLWAIDASGTATLKVSLTTINTTDITDRISMADNGTELCIISSAGFAYLYTPATNALIDIAASLPSEGCDFVTFIDSYFVVNRKGTGQFYISDSYDGATWDPLNFATAESNPDNLVMAIADKGYLILFGTATTEIWINTGAFPFPFQRVGGNVPNSGLAAPYSLSRCNGYLTGLFRTSDGTLTIAQLNGAQLQQISNYDIDYLINTYDSPNDAVGFGYALNGRAFYQITFPTQGISWLYDAMSQAWHQVKGSSITRHRADLGSAYQNRYLVTDFENGRIYTLSADAYTDNGAPIEREIIGKHQFASSMNKLIITKLRLDMEGGVGSMTDDATIMLQISRDNGHTWGNELWTTIGKLGEYMKRAEWRRLGIAEDWVFKIRMTDPYKFVLMRAVIETKEANK